MSVVWRAGGRIEDGGANRRHEHLNVSRRPECVGNRSGIVVHTYGAGAPVVNSEGRYLGFINEFDVRKALAAGKDLNNLIAEDLMRVGPIAVHASTTIEDAAKRMDEQCVLNLPVEKDGRVVCSVSRHDLLRAWIGLGLGMGIDP